VLKWLRENDCPWDEDTLVSAIRNDRYDVLRWALANGCPCDSLNEHLREAYLEDGEED